MRFLLFLLLFPTFVFSQAGARLYIDTQYTSVSPYRSWYLKQNGTYGGTDSTIVFKCNSGQVVDVDSEGLEYYNSTTRTIVGRDTNEIFMLRVSVTPKSYSATSDIRIWVRVSSTLTIPVYFGTVNANT